MKHLLHKASLVETRILLLTLAFALGIVIMSWGAQAAACSASSFIDECTIAAYTELLPSTVYYVNDSAADGAIKISSGSAVLNCNGSTIIGNTTGSAIQTQFSGSGPAKIENCTIQNYATGIRIVGGDNWEIKNINILDATYGIRTSGTANNISITNSYLGNMSTTGVNIAGSDNTTITMCKMNNVTQGIDADATSSNVTVSFTNITNTASGGILTAGRGDHKFLNNRIIYSNVASGRGIYSYSTLQSNINVSNNYIEGYMYGIHLSNSVINSFIINNTVLECNLWCIAATGNTTTIRGNTVFNSTWNLIHFSGYGHIINANTIYDWMHHGIDAHNDNNATTAGDTLIYENNITLVNNLYITGAGSSVLIDSAKNVSLYNNRFTNIRNGTQALDTGSLGIAVEGGDYAYNNKVFNNTLVNITGVCLYDDANNTLYENNMMTNCQGNNTAFIFGSFRFTENTSYPTFINNTDLSKTITFLIASRSNVTIRQNSSFNITAYTFSGNKTVNLYPTSPYSDIYNATAQNYFLADVTSTTMNLGTSETYAVRDGGCDTVPSENLYINSNAVLCPGTYNLADAGADGALIGNASSVTLTCNGTIFNGSGVGSGFYITGGKNDFRVQGCTFQNYAVGINASPYNRFTAVNNVFINNSVYGIQWWGAVQGGNFTNNNFTNSSFYIQSNTNAEIKGNTWRKCGNRYCGLSSQYNLYLFSTTQNITITNNTFDNTRSALYLNGATGGWNNIKSNTFKNADVGLRLSKVNSLNETNITNNLFVNNTNGDDAYTLDIDAFNVSNINIINNSFMESTDNSINIQQGTNINIKDNEFELICISNRANYASNAQNEPCSAIKIGQLFKSWNYVTCTTPYTNGCAKNTLSNNITVTGNTFNNETSVYLYLQGASNITHDLTNYWYKSFQWTNLTGISELFANNDLDTLRNYVRGYTTSSCALSFYEGTENNNIYACYGISKTAMYFKNTNTTVAFNVSVNNLSSPFNDVLNVTTNTLLNKSITSGTYTLTAGQEIRVGYYSPYLTAPLSFPTYGTAYGVGLIPFTVVNQSSFVNWSLRVSKVGVAPYYFGNFYPNQTYSLNPVSTIVSGVYTARVTFCQADALCIILETPFTYTSEPTYGTVRCSSEELLLLALVGVAMILGLISFVMGLVDGFELKKIVFGIILFTLVAILIGLFSLPILHGMCSL